MRVVGGHQPVDPGQFRVDPVHRQRSRAIRLNRVGRPHRIPRRPIEITPQGQRHEQRDQANGRKLRNLEPGRLAHGPSVRRIRAARDIALSSPVPCCNWHCRRTAVVSVWRGCPRGQLAKEACSQRATTGPTLPVYAVCLWGEAYDSHASAAAQIGNPAGPNTGMRFLTPIRHCGHTCRSAPTRRRNQGLPGPSQPR